LSPVTKPVTFVIMLQNFPRLTGKGVVPLTWRPTSRGGAPPAPPPLSPSVAADALGLRSYLFRSTLRPRPHVPRGVKTAAEEVDLGVTSLHSLGSVSTGSKLRIAFPLVGSEGQTPVAESYVPLPPDELNDMIQSPSSLPDQVYQPNIVPAVTKYFGGSENLLNFQVLSADPPTLAPDRSWSWNGVSDVTVLAQDLVAADAAQNRLFWSGILIGVAGGAAIVFVLELLGLLEKLSRRREALETPKSASPSSDATASHIM
jgi:hypothetical protein